MIIHKGPTGVRLLAFAFALGVLFAFVTDYACGDAWSELTAQRAHLGLPPLKKDAELMKQAQSRAEWLAAHHCRGHEGAAWGVGIIEGCGYENEPYGWASCAMRVKGEWPAGAGLAIGSDGWRYMCLIIRTRKVQNGNTTTTYSPPETNIRKPLIRTFRLSPNAPRIPYRGPWRGGRWNK